MGDFLLPILALCVILMPLMLAALGQAKAVEPLLTRTVKGAFALSSVCVLILMLVQVSVVVLRSVFSVSFIWLQESTLYLFGAIFLLSSGALLLSEGHVRVDIFYGKLTERQRQLVDLAGMALFVLPVSALIVLVSWDYVITSWVQLERSQEPSGIHAVFLLKSMIPAFAILLILAAELRMIELIRRLRTAA
ncbi:MAG: TRAP transporter small permease subunit [Pseudomonadota bacterium]